MKIEGYKLDELILENEKLKKLGNDCVAALKASLAENERMWIEEGLQSQSSYVEDLQNKAIENWNA